MTNTIILVSIIGIIIVAVAAMIIIARNQSMLAKLEREISNNKITLPLRLQAHERCLIFLERIAPDSIIVRVNQPGYTVQQLQGKLLSTIRSEFEHNLSQQIYVSQDAWTYLVNAKNNIISLINACSIKISPEMKSSDLAKLILESYAQLDTSPTSVAKQKLRNDMQKL